MKTAWASVLASFVTYPLAFLTPVPAAALATCALIQLTWLVAWVLARWGRVDEGGLVGVLGTCLAAMLSQHLQGELTEWVYFLPAVPVMGLPVLSAVRIRQLTVVLVAAVAVVLGPLALRVGTPEQVFRLVSTGLLLSIVGLVGYLEATSTENLVRLEAQRRRKEEAWEVRAARSKAANDAKTAFLASMSHELRTPLNAILGYAELLDEELTDRLGTDARGPTEDLRRIAHAGNHLRVLIDDVLDLSKVEAGRLQTREEDVDLAPFVDELEQTAQPLVDVRGNRLVLDVPEGLRVRADRVRLRQVLLNLLGNSAKFTNQGTIAVIARQDGDCVAIVVRDTGCGMTPAQLASAFEAFSQVGDADAVRVGEGGTGLGLPLALQLTRAMGGRMRGFSEPDVGTEFLIRLPSSAPVIRQTRPRRVAHS